MASKVSDTDFYKLLGVERNASEESIIKAFRNKARLFHPDKNPGNDDLMKLINAAKVTLIDPHKRAQYDDTYIPEDDVIPDGEKVFLPMGKKLSASFIEKIQGWIEEYEEIEICDNMYVSGAKWIDLRDKLDLICKDITSENTESETEYHKLLKSRNTTTSLKDKLAQIIPESIFRMNGVNPNTIFYKESLIKDFGNWRNTGDDYFVEGHYEIALFCYQKASNNSLILEKANQLFRKKNFETSLLYFRYLFDIDEYKRISTTMLLKISFDFYDKKDSFKEIFDFFKIKLPPFIPDHIMNMNGVNNNRIFFKQSFIEYFGNWKISGDEYFGEEHYKTALYCYQKASDNKVILQKAHHLYLKGKYETSMLYFRYLLNIDEYKPDSTLMLLEILFKTKKHYNFVVIFDFLKVKLPLIIPDHIWNMNGVNPNPIFFKQTLIQYFGDWKNFGDEYFVEEEYKTALFCYQKSCDNAVILGKAGHLYGKKNYQMSLLYFRYLFDLNRYKPISTLMMLEILEIILDASNESLFDAALNAANEFPTQARIHMFLLKLLLEKEMIHEAKCAIDAIIGLKSKIGEEVVEKLLEKQRDLVKVCEQKDYKKLQALVYAHEIEKISQYIKDHQCTTVVGQLYTDLTKGQDISQLPGRYRATLSILLGVSLQNENKYVESSRCFQEALFLFPNEETASAVSNLLNNKYFLPTIQQILHEVKLCHVEFPKNHKYLVMQTGSPLLRTVFKYEKHVLKTELKEFEKAMLYIDLTMACGHPSIMASNFLIAAYFLLKGMKTEENVAIKYAYRNTICDLAESVFFISNLHMDPVALMHFVKLSIALMNSSHEILRTSISNNKKAIGKRTIHLINPSQEELLTSGNNLLLRAIKVNPLVDVPITLSGDVLYINYAGILFLENYYNFMTKKNPSHPWNHLFNYSLFEGSWKTWANEEKFQKYRENAMKALLNTKGWTLSDVENIMSMSIVNHDAHGWWDIDEPWINLPNENFDSIDGVVIDLKKGEFRFLLNKSKTGSGLFNWDDILDMCENDITESFFTLNQPDFELNSHPFQEMKYGPKQLKKTNYLMTLLAADYLLKMFSTGTEVSAKEPFLFRNAYEGLLKVLPDKLREAVKPIHQRKNRDSVCSIHRFWIESGELPFNIDIDNEKDTKTFTFEYCPMVIKKHMMKHNKNGELIDDDDEEEEDAEQGDDGNENNKLKIKKYSADYKRKTISAEKEFANDFTSNYDEIGYYFPVLLRLREFVKISACITLIKICYKEKQIGLELLNSQRNDILRLATDVLLENSDIASDNFLLNSLNRRLCEDIFSQVESDFKKSEMEKLNRYEAYCRKFGIKLNTKIEFEFNEENECVWVPAAFGKNNFRVYGGVRLKVNLVPAKGMNKSGGTSISGGISSKSSSNGTASGGGNGSSFNQKSFSSASGGSGSDEREKKLKKKGKYAPKHCGQIARKYKFEGRKNLKIGNLPPGQYKIINLKYSSKKDAYEAAKRAGGGNEPVLHYTEERGGQPHYHATYGHNEKLHKLEDGKHYRFPRGK
jgi:curved DNA-binding protein CbpA